MVTPALRCYTTRPSRRVQRGRLHRRGDLGHRPRIARWHDRQRLRRGSRRRRLRCGSSRGRLRCGSSSHRHRGSRSSVAPAITRRGRRRRGCGWGLIREVLCAWSNVHKRPHGHVKRSGAQANAPPPSTDAAAAGWASAAWMAPKQWFFYPTPPTHVRQDTRAALAHTQCVCM
jgi:hypothetical protein